MVQKGYGKTEREQARKSNSIGGYSPENILSNPIPRKKAPTPVSLWRFLPTVILLRDNKQRSRSSDVAPKLNPYSLSE